MTCTPIVLTMNTQRTAGSVRFQTYYKLQWFDEISLAWRDIQKAHATVEDAEQAMKGNRKWRIMEITPSGRHPLP